MSYSCSDLADDMLAFCVRQGIVTDKQARSRKLNDNPAEQAELMMQGILKLKRVAKQLIEDLKAAHQAPPQPAGDAITIPCTLTYPDNLMRDLMTTAVEGGINYWCDAFVRERIAQDHPDEASNIVRFEADIIDGPVACDHPDIEAAEIGRFTMDAATMRQGIARLLAPDAQVSPATRNCVLLMGMDSEADQGDAETADSIVQFAVFGEIVFG